MLKKRAKLKAHRRALAQFSEDLRMLGQYNYIERSQNLNIHHK